MSLHARVRPAHSLGVRIFNETGQLVGAYLTSPILAGTGLKDSSGKLLWYVPSGTDTVEIAIAVIPYTYNDPIFGYYDTTPRGISGFPDYSGGRTIEVDCVNWYRPGGFYPPVPGLLMGENYHLILGSPAGPLGWTRSTMLLPDNYLGPFLQSGVWNVPNAHLGGNASVVFGLDLNGYVSGEVFGFTWGDELRTLSGTYLRATAQSGVFSARSIDGFYEMYLPGDSYTLSAVTWSQDDGYRTYETRVAVSSGSFMQGVNIYFERSEIPMPEMTWTGPVVILVIATALTLTMRLHPSTRKLRSPSKGQTQSD